MLASMAGYAVPMIISLITTPLVLNALGVTAYGLISLVSVIIGYLTVMDMGLDLPITKYQAEDQAKVDTGAAN
jgi:O-antigen/teichoic acid export membrane protein